jgi:Ser/Thr protein kinase RdoA (MazF antagonist)
VDFGALEQSLSALGLRRLRRIVDGWQSLAVYEAVGAGRPVAVKVVDPGLVDRAALEVRLAVLTRLAGTCEWVCGPVALAGHLVNDVEPDEVTAGAHGELLPPRHLIAVAYEFADGEPPDITQPEVAARMGRALADLHTAMAGLPAYALPELAAFPPLSRLEKVAGDLGMSTAWLPDALPDDEAGPHQLLHGDFSSKNMRLAGASWRIFDFDDCGYGPVELDLANSVYFVLFDATLRQDLDRYRRFRTSFLGGYHERSGRAPSATRMDALLTRRVLTLASWLADPDTAPSGIRTASAEWMATLRDFVQRYLGTLETTGATG